MERNFLIGVVVVAGVIAAWLMLRRREHYGAMKNIRQIPFNDCVRICNGYRTKCVSDFINADPTWCDRRFDACKAECYYTPYHQMQG